jgi:hypothetical protein
VAIIVASHGCSPLKVLFAPLLATFDALLGALSGDVERRLSYPVLRSNRELIVCVPRNQVYTHTVQKMDTE